MFGKVADENLSAVREMTPAQRRFRMMKTRRGKEKGQKDYATFCLYIDNIVDRRLEQARFQKSG